MNNKNIKIGYKKSKAYGLCGVILTAVLLAIMAPNAYADEVSSAEPATETVAPAAETTTEAPASETVASTSETTTNTTEETPTVERAPTEVSKESTTIKF